MASQGANNGRPLAAGNQFVKFSRASAQRIANVVRQVEAGNREQQGVRFDHPVGVASGKNVRLCTFTGTWAVDGIATITFSAATSQTATAINSYMGVSGGTGFVARDGTAWYLVGVKLTMQPGYDGGQVQVLGHSSAGIIQWYSVTTCSTSTAS